MSLIGSKSEPPIVTLVVSGYHFTHPLIFVNAKGEEPEMIWNETNHRSLLSAYSFYSDDLPTDLYIIAREDVAFRLYSVSSEEPPMTLQSLFDEVNYGKTSVTDSVVGYVPRVSCRPSNFRELNPIRFRTHNHPNSLLQNNYTRNTLIDYGTSHLRTNGVLEEATYFGNTSTVDSVVWKVELV